MRGQAVGFIETVGMVAALEAADAAAKAANVRVLGYELTKGGGMVTVKMQGDVGAVQAAVAAGASAASRVGKVVRTLVIPRPHPDVERLLPKPDEPANSPAPEQPPVPKPEPAPEPQPAPEEQPAPVPEPAPAEAPAPEAPPQHRGGPDDATGPPAIPLAAGEAEEAAEGGQEICNLCGDPACPRRPGQARRRCIHYGDTRRR